MRLILIGFLVLLTSTVNAKELPNFSIVFDISMAGLPAGESEYSLQANHDGTYTLKTVCYAVGAFKALFSGQYILSSRFQIQNNQAKPIFFEDKITTGKKPLTQRFDWQENRAHIDSKKGVKQLKIEEGTQDVLSYHIELANSLKKGMKTVSYPVVVGRKLKTYQIKVLGEEVLNTKLGPIETIKVTRLQDDKRKTYVWLAPELNYIPVQAEHIEKGISFMAELNNMKGLEGFSKFQKIADHQ